MGRENSSFTKVAPALFDLAASWPRPLLDGIPGPRSYQDTVDFYETHLTKAGFTMGPKTANASRWLYQCTFTDGTVRDTLTIHTRPGDNRGLLTIRIRYTLPPGSDTTPH